VQKIATKSGRKRGERWFIIYKPSIEIFRFNHTLMRAMKKLNIIFGYGFIADWRRWLEFNRRERCERSWLA